MDNAEIQEAAETVYQSAGMSAYLHGVNYSLEQFLQELGEVVKYIKAQGGHS